MGKAREPPTTTETPTTSATTTATSTTTGPTPPKVPGVPLEVAFSHCRGGETNFEYPQSIGPGQYPKGWSAPDPTNLDEVSLLMAECSRISWGPFERGPIHLLFERHDHMNPPTNCTNRDGITDTFAEWVLNSLWLDDQDLANYLKATYGVPAIYAQMSVAQDLHSGAGTQVWSWNEPAKAASQVTYYVIPTSNSTDHIDVDRMYWYNDTSLSYMDLREAPVFDDNSATANPGTMQPPMLYAYQGMTTYLGTGGKFDSLDLSAKLHRYGDFQCTSPLRS